MGKIIKFEPKSDEERFIESLEEWQLEIFYYIFEKAKSEYDDLMMEYAKKVTECALLKMENKALKGGQNDT